MKKIYRGLSASVAGWQIKTPAAIFIILFLINLFNYIDRQVLYAVFPLIQTDLNLSDTKLGMLASSFMIVYMLFSPVSGFFGDRGQREKWIGTSVILWSMATLMAAFSKNYGHLFMARSAVGIGEAGFTTQSPSLISEYFSKEKRARILSIFSAAMPIGAALGYLCGGYFGQHYGWRAAFIILAIPGIFIGLVAYFIRDPKADIPKSDKPLPPTLKQYLTLFSNKPFLFVSLSQAMLTFVIGAFATWMPTFMTRYFEFSLAKAGLMFGAITVLGGLVGTVCGGFIADRLHKKTDKAYFIVIALSNLLALPFAVLGICSSNANAALCFLFMAEVFIFMPMGPTTASIIANTKRGMRSMAFAVNILIIHILGDAISPTIVGKISDLSNLRFSLLLSTFIVILAAVFSFLAGKFQKAEEAF